MMATSDAGVPSRDVPVVVDPRRGSRAPSLELTQGVYYLATGVWPLISPSTFQAVTGPKADLWLTKTVGALAGVIGGVLTYAGVRGRRPSEVAMLAMGAAGAFAAVDLTYVAKKRISPVYLVDAVGQLALLGLWAFGRGHLPWRRAGAPGRPTR